MASVLQINNEPFEEHLSTETAVALVGRLRAKLAAAAGEGRPS